MTQTIEDKKMENKLKEEITKMLWDLGGLVYDTDVDEMYELIESVSVRLMQWIGTDDYARFIQLQSFKDPKALDGLIFQYFIENIYKK